MNLALLSTYDATLVPTAPVPGPRSLGWSDAPPEGLTDLDLTRITEAIAAGRAASTRRSYAWQWGRFERWCAGRGITSMPATPATVCAYLTDFAAQGVAAGTIDRTTARGSRDAALILLGFASALRRSELAGLELADIEPKPEGLLICVRKSKTDPEARGQLVGVAHGNHRATDPVTALNDWLTHRGTQPGQLFRGFIRNRIATRPFTGSGLARVLKERAAAAGIPSEHVSGHSLRAGHATTAAQAGVGLDRIAAQTRHTRISTLVEHYIRPLETMQVTSSRDLRL